MSAPIRLTGIALALMAMASCGNHARTEPAPVVKVEPKVAVPPPLTVTEQGVGPIGPMTVVDVPTLAKLLPGYSVTAETGDPTVVVVSRENKQLLAIKKAGGGSGLVDSISILSADVPAPHGIHIGDRLESLLKYGPQKCEWDTVNGEESTDFMWCHASESSVLSFKGNSQLIPDDKKTDSDDVPPQALMAMVTISTVRWDAEDAWLAQRQVPKAATLAMTITQQGVGPIVSTTTVDARIVGPLFPGYVLKKDGEYMETTKVANSIEVSRDGQAVLVLHSSGPDSKVLDHVEVKSPDIACPSGVRVGYRLDALTRLGAPTCTQGEEQQSGILFCDFPGEPLCGYEIDLGDSDIGAEDGKTWDLEAVRKLKVTGINWGAKKAAPNPPDVKP